MELKDKQFETNTKVDVLIERINGWEDKFGQRLDHIIDQTTKTNGSVKDLKAWKEDVCYPLKEIIEERKDNTKRIKDIAWSLIKQGATIVATAVVTTGALLVGLDKLIK